MDKMSQVVVVVTMTMVADEAPFLISTAAADK